MVRTLRPRKPWIIARLGTKPPNRIIRRYVRGENRTSNHPNRQALRITENQPFNHQNNDKN